MAPTEIDECEDPSMEPSEGHGVDGRGFKVPPI